MDKNRIARRAFGRTAAALASPDADPATGDRCGLRRCQEPASIRYVLDGGTISLCETHWLCFAGRDLDLGLSWLRRLRRTS